MIVRITGIRWDADEQTAASLPRNVELSMARNQPDTKPAIHDRALAAAEQTYGRGHQIAECESMELVP